MRPRIACGAGVTNVGVSQARGFKEIIDPPLAAALVIISASSQPHARCTCAISLNQQLPVSVFTAPSYADHRKRDWINDMKARTNLRKSARAKNDGIRDTLQFHGTGPS